MSIRTRNIHFTNWAKVIEALADKGVTVADESAARTFLIETSSDANPYYYYVGYIKDTQEIYTHGKFYNCAGYDDTELRELIQNIEDSFTEQITSLQNEVEENEKATTMALYDLNDRKADKDDLQNINLDKYVDWDSLYSETSSLQSTINSNYTTLDNNKANKTDLETLSAEVEENEEVTAAALTELHENKADKSEIPDVSTLATKDDLNLKQDLLSAADFATVNGTSVFGGDNAIVIEEPDHYASGSATVEGSGFVTSVTTNEDGHVTKVTARAITDNDITSISASKITGTIDIDRLPHGALERLYVLTNRTAALENTEISEGDTIMLTEENNTMFFCVSNTATTFDDKFREYTAASATSVAWSGVTDKPDLATQEELDVVDAKFDDYFLVSDFTKANIKSTLGISDWALASAKPTYAYSEISGTPTSLKNPNALSWSGYSSGSYDGSTAQNIVLPTKLSQLTDDVVSGKYLSLAGGAITGEVTITAAANSPLRINSTATDSGIYFNLNGTAKTWVGYESAKGSVLYHSEGSHRLGINNAGVAFFDSNTLLHSGNYNTYSPSLTGTGASGSWGIDITGTASNANKLNNYYSSRPTSADVPITGDGSLFHFKSTSVMTTSKPNGDGHILHFNWDNAGGFDAQLFLPGGGNTVEAMQYRNQKAKTWGSWKTLIDSDNISSQSVKASTYLGSAGYYGLRYSTFTKTDNGGSATWVLIADVTNLHTGNETGTHYGFVGYAVDSRNSGYMRESVTKIICRYGYSAATSIDEMKLSLFSDGSNIWPQLVEYDSKYYLAIRLIGSGRLISFFTRDTTLAGSIIQVTDSSLITLVVDGRYFNRYVNALAVINDESIGGNLTVGGTVRATGMMYAPDFVTTSDNRLKDFVSDIYIDFESLKQIPKKYYYWKDKSMGEDLQLGTSAQELAKIYPECVSYDEKEDKYSVSYQKLSIVALAAIDKLYDEIKELKSKLND